MSTGNEQSEGRAPRLFTVQSLPRTWIAEGTDGFLYRVPDEPGGWNRRQRYEGHRAKLDLVTAEVARDVVRRVNGEWGAVQIAFH